MIYLLLSALLLCALIPTVYAIVQNSLQDSLVGNMEISASAVSDAIGKEEGRVFVNQSEISKDDIKPGIYIQVVDAEGDVLYHSLEAEWIFEMVEDEEDEADLEKDWTYLVKEKNIDGESVKIQILGSIYFNEFLGDFIWILLLLIPIYILLAGIGSRFLANRALRPIRQITETAKKISHGDLSERIEGITSKDEVGELADTFNQMLEDVEASFKRERQFTSDASHELRTPMTVINACTEDALYTDDASVREENIRAIQKENCRMTKMVSQLLMLSRGYEGRYQFQKEKLGLYDMVESVTESLFPLAEDKNICLHNEIPEDMMILADQSLLTQLLVNLIENAIKYGKNQGNVWITMEEKEGDATLLIKDDGMGIAEEDLQHIFDRFYRADKARDRSGSGLGLAIAMWIVDLHGWKIEVKSEVDNGTTFMIQILEKFPLANPVG